MTPIGPHLTAFLREYIPSQREMSVQTSDTYAYAFQLLVCFAAERLKTTPSALSIEQLDATLVLAFLEHLETNRGNCARTRNSRLAGFALPDSAYQWTAHISCHRPARSPPGCASAV